LIYDVLYLVLPLYVAITVPTCVVLSTIFLHSAWWFSPTNDGILPEDGRLPEKILREKGLPIQK